MKIRPGYIFIAAYLLFLVISTAAGFAPGRAVAGTFISYARGMAAVLPCAFILIGLFEVWVDRETVKRSFGRQSGPLGYLWALLLSMTTVGGSYVAFPVAHALYGKGATYNILLTYLGAATILRVPMTTFELSFLGPKFTLLRLFLSLPLLILSSAILGRYLERISYHLPDLSTDDDAGDS
ncbi:MAG: permease [Bacillota bacterium]